MSPIFYSYTGNVSAGIFRNLDDGFRAMAWPNQEYVLGTNQAKSGLEANLPPGIWQVTSFDALAKEEKVLSKNVTGKFRFDAPASRAVLFHFKKIK